MNNIEEIQQNNEDLSEILERIYKDYRASPVAQTVKNLPANAGDTGLIPGSGRSPGERSGNPLQYFPAWEISRTEEHGGLQSVGSQELDMT